MSPRCTGPLFYVEFDAQSLRLGVGVKEFDARTLAAYRALVAGVTGRPPGQAVLEGMVDLAGRQKHEVLGPVLVRPPKGFPDGANPALLSRKGLFVSSQTALPKAIFRAEFVGYCERWFRPYVPLFETLRALASSTLGAEA